MRRSSLLLIALLGCLIGQWPSRATAPAFRVLGVADGLSSREVYEVEQDSTGFIWTYTHNAIDRYDGSMIRHYELQTDVDSRDYIHPFTTMLTDPRGHLWVVLKDGRIYAYNPLTDSFELKMDMGSETDNVAIYHALFDPQGRLWLASSAGLYLWDGSSMQLQALEGQWVKALAYDPLSGQLYVGTSEGLYSVDPAMANLAEGSKPTAKALHLPSALNIESLYVAPSKIFIGTSASGIWMMNRASGLTVRLDYVPVVPVRVFALTQGGELLAGVDGAGVFVIDPSDGHLLDHYMANEDAPVGLGANTISDLLVDHNGGIWVGTSTYGISYLAPTYLAAKQYRHEPNNRNSLRSNHVNLTFEDRDGDLWIGTNHGISRFIPAKKQWEHYLGGHQHNATVVLTADQTADGELWVGGYGIGVYRINKATGSVAPMALRSKESPHYGTPSEYIYSIKAIGDEVWMAGLSGGLAIYNRKTDTYKYLSADCIDNIVESRDGTIWLIGCEGLAHMKDSSDKLEWKNTFGSIPLRYPIASMTEAHDGTIWLATDGDGLIAYNPLTETYNLYTSQDGIDSNSLNNVVEDPDHRIWFNTELELYCLDPATGMIANVNDFLDPSTGYYTPRTATLLRSGNLLLGSAEGALELTPSLAMRPLDDAKLIFTDLDLLYQNIKAAPSGSPLKKHINDAESISLAHDQNSFSISFSALNIETPHRLNFQYKMEGYDKEWHQADRPSSVSYTNLLPGRYTFVLKGYDRWTGSEIASRSVDILIATPWWASWWAFAIYILIAAAAIWAWLSYRRQKQNERRTSERIQSFVSMAHDIRTPVSLIKAPLSELERQPDLSPESRESISIATKNVDRLQNMISQLLNLRHSDADTDPRLKVSLIDINEYITEKVEGYRIVAMQKGLKIEWTPIADKSVTKVWASVDKVDHVIDNLVSNAIKYTPQGSITISSSCDKKRWQISVKDTGIGIPASEQHNIFKESYRANNALRFNETGAGIGLMVVWRLVKEMGGRIAFESQEGEGSQFTVSFPCQYNGHYMIAVETPHTPAPTASEATIEGVDGAVSSPLPADDLRPLLLVAEDNAELRSYIAQRLDKEYRILTASDGAEALEKARAQAPDLILSDIKMPQLSGLELCKLIKGDVETSHIPFVLLTGLNRREEVLAGLEAGANDYVIKPFDMAELKLRLRNILATRQKLRDSIISVEAEEETPEYSNPLDREFMERVRDVVNEELSNTDLSINDFCRKLCMSRTSVYNKLKALTGQGPNDFIRIIRLNKSLELLRERTYNVSEVACMVGFSDPKYFSTCFKKQFGVSPSKILSSDGHIAISMA